MTVSQNTNFLGRPQGQEVSGVWVHNGVNATSLTDLRTLVSAEQSDGNERRVANGWRYIWNSTSVLADDALFVVKPSDNPAAGRWLLAAGQMIDFAYAFTFALADATVLMTVPTGARVQLVNTFWKVNTSFTGGSSSAIGVKGGAATGLTTAGDVLGGASGDVLATLVSTGAYAKGTIGAKMGKPGAVLNAADTLIYNQITSAFTVGIGEIHVVFSIIANVGA